MSDPADVAQQYTTDSLVDRIDGALAEAGLDAARLDWRDLAPFDNFHSRGVAATTDLARALAPEPGTHVLDIAAAGSVARHACSPPRTTAASPGSTSPRPP